MKQEGKKVSEERHLAAKQLQTALDQVIPSSENKLKSVSMNLAKFHIDTVCPCVGFCITVGHLILVIKYVYMLAILSGKQEHINF